MNVTTEAVEMSAIPTLREKGSAYDAALNQVMTLEVGEGIVVKNDSNKHLRNTLYQLIVRRELKGQIRVFVSNKETYLQRIA